MSAAVFHVKHSVDTHRVRAGYPSQSETTVGPRQSKSRPHRESQDQSRLLLIERRPRRQGIDQPGEVLIARELNGDAPLLRSTGHLDASVKGIGQPG